MASTKDYLLTTIDNPYNPWTNWDQWYDYDERMGYHTCSYLARVMSIGDSMTDEECDREYEFAMNEIIYTMCGSRANLYAVMKEILKRKGVNVGGVRAPLTPVSESDLPVVEHSMAMIDAAIEKYSAY